MVAVGLWGAFLGMPAIWILPVTFPLVMTVGGALGVAGVPLPGVEIGIALSAIVLGAMVAFAARPPIWIAAVIVATFAIFHGHAHGTELPNAADPIAYSLGFVIATGLLHLAGIAIGLVVRWPRGKVLVRACGVVISMAGRRLSRASDGMKTGLRWFALSAWFWRRPTPVPTAPPRASAASSAAFIRCSSLRI